MPNLTSSAATFRRGGFSYTGWLATPTETVVLQGTISAVPTYPTTQLSYTLTSGSTSDVKQDMKVDFFSSGGTKKGTLRVAMGQSVTSTVLPVSEFSEGVYSVSSGDTFKVYRIWNIHDRLVSATSDLNKDSRLAVSTYTSDPPPVCNSGGLYVGFNPSVSFDGSTSYVVDPDSSSLTHSWSFGDGTPSTSSSATPTVTFPVGERWVTHTVTDSGNSRTTTQYIWVRIFDSDNPPLSVQVDSLSGAVDSGWRCTFKLPVGNEGSITNLADGSLIAYFETSYYNNTEASYGSNVTGRSGIAFVGYLVSESVHIDPDSNECVFEAVSPLEILSQTPALPQLMVNANTPTKWSEVKGLSTKKMFAYLSYWHSTVQDAFDFVMADILDISYDRIAVEGATIADQLRDIANGLNLQVTCDRLGRILFARDPAFLTSGQRASRTKTYDLTTADIMEIDMTRQHRYTVKTVRGEGITDTNAPVFSNAPGDAPASLGTGSDTLAKQIVSSQSQLNDRTGYYFAKINSLYNGRIVPKGVRVKLPMGYDWFDPAYREFVTLTLASTTNARGIAFTTATKWTVEAVDITYDPELGSKDITVTLDHETSGVAGTTYIPPQEGDNGLPDLPDITIDLPVLGFDPGTGYGVDPGAVSGGGVTSPSTKTMAAFCSDNKVYLTANFSHPEASGGPTWDATDLTALSGWGGGTLLAFEVDPWSSSYLGTGSTVDGWLLTTTKVQKINDIFGTPTLSTAYSLAYTSSTRTIAVSRSVQDFVIVASWYSSHGVYAAVTTNGTSWAEAAVTAYENTAAGGITPGVWISPHTDGKAYISVWTATGNNSTATTGVYKTTNYGSSWSALASPTVDSGVDVASTLAIAFDNAPGNRIFHRKKATSGTITLNRNSNGTETDITPTISTIAYSPIGQYDHELAISDDDENTMAGLFVIGILPTTDDFTTGSHGWSSSTSSAFSPTNMSNYTGGTGFTQQASSGVAFTNNRFTQSVIEKALAGTPLLSIDVYYTSLNAGNDADPLGQNPQGIIEIDGTTLLISNNLGAGTGSFSWTGSTSGTLLKIGIDVGFRDDSVACTGTVTITKVVLNDTVGGGGGLIYALTETENAIDTAPTWATIASGDETEMPYRQVFSIGGGEYVVIGENGAIGVADSSGIDSRIGDISTSGRIVGTAGV